MAGPSAISQNPQWTSRFAFLMAAIGSAVGLGNLWRFPFQTGQNGGSAFVFIYLLSVIIVAYPILVGEISIGRHKGLSAVGSTSQLAKDAGRSSGWGLVGLVGVAAAYLILATYSVVAGQVMAYSIMSFMGEFAAPAAGAAASSPPSLYAGAGHAILWHTLFMAATIWIVSRGLSGGIERVVTILMPMFFVMLAGVSIYSLASGASGDAIAYLFTPRFSELTPVVVLAALGQAFFSIGVGMSLMITYGSFLDKKENIASSGGIVAGADTLVAIIAGLMIFPIVFANGLDPAAGMSLIFSALPNVFASMPAGSIIGGVFFLLAFVAALTSSIAMLLAASLVGEEQLKLGKVTSAVAFGGVAWVIGAFTIIKPAAGPALDFVSGSVILPLGALLVAVFAGWIVPRTVMRGELQNASDGVFGFWRIMVRYVAPIIVFVTLLLGLDAKFGFGLNAFIAASGAS